METRFVEYSEIQVFVENKIQISDEDLIDTLYINIGSEEPKITIIIEDSTGEEISFLINSATLKKITNWLKEKQVIE